LELTAVHLADRVHRQGDVIFVHGLDGDARSTWEAQDQSAFFWPCGLADELPDHSVWTLGYDAPISSWRTTSSPLLDLATDALSVLEAHGIGEFPVFFIAHSFGGLLVKQMLRHATSYGNARWQALHDQVSGIVFLATPHAGAAAANWLLHLRGALRASVSIKELEAHNPQLRDLNLWFRSHAQKTAIPLQVYSERQPTRGLQVVDPTSADPGIAGVTPILLDADHTSIAKPSDRSRTLCLRVHRFIEDCSARAHANRTESQAEPPRRDVPTGDRETRTSGKIRVFLADDNLIIREGVRALLELESDIEIVGVAADYEGVTEGAIEAAPQVIVTDIRMPPTFQREGIDAAREVRRRHPGTGIVILSQYEEPAFAASLLSEGAAGIGYLLKDRVAEGDQLVRAVREVSTGGSVIDPRMVEAFVNPLRSNDDLTPTEEGLLAHIAEGRPIKAIALSQRTTPEAVSAAIDKLFLKLARNASEGRQGALERLKTLHRAILESEQQGERLSRLLPSGLAERLRAAGYRIGQTEVLEVTVLMSDIRGYSAIAERADPSALAQQLGEHRAAMSTAIADEEGAVMQFVGDAVMAAFGALLGQERHAERALAAARAMHAAQDAINRRWRSDALSSFHLGIGLSTGRVAAALLGSEERLEYSLVGDSVNLAQRLQQWAGPGEIVVSQTTADALDAPLDAEVVEKTRVKGREGEVRALRVRATSAPA
jgi:adenylate cyclase